jgi:hypothetical protein
METLDDMGAMGKGKRQCRETREEEVGFEVKVRDWGVQTDVEDKVVLPSIGVGLPSFARLMREIEVVWMVEETSMVPCEPRRFASRGWSPRGDIGVRRYDDPLEKLDRWAGYRR